MVQFPVPYGVNLFPRTICLGMNSQAYIIIFPLYCVLVIPLDFSIDLQCLPSSEKPFLPLEIDFVLLILKATFIFVFSDIHNFPYSFNCM
jgi:hypothetical protein